MKRLVRASEDIFAMSKIVDKYAIDDVAANLKRFIYFSECNASHGPRIKFYGGSKETSSTKDAPTLAYDVSGNCTVELADLMDKKNCPNAFDDAYLTKLEWFINKYKPILLLVWFKHLDEADALAYFHGQISLDELIDDVDYRIPQNIRDLLQLDSYCRANDLYIF